MDDRIIFTKDARVRGTSVIPTSKILVSVIFFLQTVGNKEVQSFMNICQLVKKFRWGECTYIQAALQVHKQLLDTFTQETKLLTSLCLYICRE
jgi:hypothetical protein